MFHEVYYNRDSQNSFSVYYDSRTPKMVDHGVTKIPLTIENSASYLKIQAGKTFSYHGHALVTLYVQFLCSDWSKFDS